MTRTMFMPGVSIRDLRRGDDLAGPLQSVVVHGRVLRAYAYVPLYETCLAAQEDWPGAMMLSIELTEPDDVK